MAPAGDCRRSPNLRRCFVKRRTRTIQVSRIEPNCRFVFARETIDHLVRSVLREGQKQPIRIWFTGRCFRILDGEKRWRAAKRIGMATITAVIDADNPSEDAVNQEPP
jgi:ParB/RepB/Spo0J family partition protein